MNAGSPQKIHSAQDLINAVDQFHKKCENKTVKKDDVDQFALIISNTSHLNLDKNVANRLEDIVKAVRGLPPQQLITKIDDLSRYLKEEKNMKSKVTSKDNEGLPKR